MRFDRVGSDPIGAWLCGDPSQSCPPARSDRVATGEERPATCRLSRVLVAPPVDRHCRSRYSQVRSRRRRDRCPRRPSGRRSVRLRIGPATRSSWPGRARSVPSRRSASRARLVRRRTGELRASTGDPCRRSEPLRSTEAAQQRQERHARRGDGRAVGARGHRHRRSEDGRRIRRDGPPDQSGPRYGRESQECGDHHAEDADRQRAR